ncbi:major facilitator superfamily domain-containing protein [Chytridium lagenaria]|nr:major facilitator superfamily domain-containing protein [Chytridium lagenaria]
MPVRNDGTPATSSSPGSEKVSSMAPDSIRTGANRTSTSLSQEYLSTPSANSESQLQADSSEMTAPVRPRPVGRMVNVVALGIAFFLIFMAFSVVQNLASSTLPDRVAFLCLGAIYVSFAIFNLLTAAPIVDKIGCRAALFFASMTYVTLDIAYTIALSFDDSNVQLGILFPASVLIGFGASILWTAQGTYLTRCATKGAVGAVSSIFFGIFGASSVLGPLLVVALLKTSLSKPAVFGILSGVGAAGSATLLYLWTRPEPVPEQEDPAILSPEVDGDLGNLENTLTTPYEEIETEQRFVDVILKTARLCIDQRLICLLPLIYVTALGQTFYSGLLPRFLSQSSDLTDTLFLFAVLGTASTLTSFGVGSITDSVDSRVTIGVVSIMHSTALVLLWAFDNPGSIKALMFACAVILGASDAVLMNQIYKLIPALFPDQKLRPTAFAAYRFNGSMMTGIGFVVSLKLVDPEVQATYNGGVGTSYHDFVFIESRGPLYRYWKAKTREYLI